MRQLITFLVAGFLVVAAFSLSAPPNLDPDPAVTTTVAEEIERVSRFFHCPWSLANDRNDSSYALMTAVDTQFSMSHPENGSIDEGESGSAPLGAAISVDNVRVLGVSNAIVEFVDGPAAAAVVTIGEDGLAGDICPSNLPAVWHVSGGSTREGETLSLRLFNPFADDARVNLSAVSELGPEANDSFQSVSVPARSTRTFSLEVELPGREALSVFVEQLEGSVIPVMVQSTGTDLAMWPGTRHSEVWEFPLAAEGGLETELILTNTAPIDVTYSIEIFDETATVLSGETGTISGPGQARVPLVDVGAEVFGLRITADGPFGAVVVGRGDGAVVATVGASTVSDSWLVPGPNAESRAGYRLWLLNAGVDPITVTYRKANATGAGDVASIEVAAGAVASVVVTDIATTGLAVSGTGPFSVAWSGEFDGHRMFSGRCRLENELVVRGLVVLAVVVGVLIIARVRPSRRPAALSISGNLDGPGVFLFTSEQCDSCSAARDVYRTVLGEGGFVEHSWDSDSDLLTRLGVQEIPVGTVIDSEGIEIASFRLVPKPGALARAVRKMHR